MVGISITNFRLLYLSYLVYNLYQSLTLRLHQQLLHLRHFRRVSTIYARDSKY